MAIFYLFCILGNLFNVHVNYKALFKFSAIACAVHTISFSESEFGGEP